MTVGLDCTAVETSLGGGELRCPAVGCGGLLGMFTAATPSRPPQRHRPLVGQPTTQLPVRL